MEEKVTTKTRKLLETSAPATYFDGYKSTDYTHVVTARQVTTSRSNPLFLVQRNLKQRVKHHTQGTATGPVWYTQREADELIKNKLSYDCGSDFYTSRQRSNLASRFVSSSTRAPGNLQLSFQGQLRPSSVTSKEVDWKDKLWPVPFSTQTELQYVYQLGTEAIAKTAPTSPEFSLMTALGELRSDGIPSMIGSTIGKARGFKKLAKAGDEYLNFEFGWKPFVSDILSLMDTVKKSEEILAKYERESGRFIGRHYSFPPQTTVSVTELGFRLPNPSMSTYAYEGSGTRQGTESVTKEVTRTSWFEGSYRYYLPLASDARARVSLYAAKAEKLLGLRITPEVLWNLAPWSWLADWVLNIGSIMSNISNFGKDSLMLHRGYIMSTYDMTDTYVNTGVNLKGFGHTGTITEVFGARTKTRRRASPYGFGVNVENFTTRQIAILAALGISRFG